MVCDNRRWPLSTAISSQVMSRFVMIDDTNPSIQYSGPWFEVDTSNTQLETLTGTLGPPFKDTIHGVNVTASFSFAFSGSAVIVYGTSNTTNASGTQDPTWGCFVDNISIDSSLPSSVILDRSENNWILCGAGPAQLQDGPHLLTVNASVSNQQTFWFDQIQYAPSASVSLNQSLVRIDSSDPAIQYSPAGGWQSMDNPINYTSSLNLVNFSSTGDNGANLIYEFSGTSISLFGSAAAAPISNGTYTVDDQQPITFSVGVGNASDNVLSNEMLFQTGQLSLGQHKLVVTYLGNNITQRLFFSYFVQVQQDGPSSTSSNSPTSTIVPSGGSSNSSPGKPTAAIIGGVIGGLVLILLLVGLLLFLRRRNNRRSKTLSEMSYIVPSPDAVNPSTFLPENYTSNGQSLPSPSITHRSQPSDFVSSSNSGGIPPLSPLQPQFSSPGLIRLSPSSPDLPLIGSQTNVDGAKTTAPHATTEPSLQQSPSPQGTTARFIRHEDSGVRIPAAEDDDDVVELPPLYTPG